MTSHPNRSRTGGRAKMGRPPKAADERHVNLQITLPPDLAARVRAEPEGASQAIARALRAAYESTD